MIQVNELRVGNWVYDDNITLSKVIGFKPFDWSVRCDEEEGCEILLDLYRTPYGVREGMLCESAKCEAIPLTPEILEKCGFKRHTYEMSGCKVWYLQDTSWRVAQSYRDENEYKLWHERVSPPTWNLKTLSYLHELQNLIYALTNTELTYQP